MVKIMRNRSDNSHCYAECGKSIKHKEWCVYLITLYGYNFSQSARIHFTCIDRFIKLLKKLRKDYFMKVIVEEL